MSHQKVSAPSVPAVDWQDWGAACADEDPAVFFAPDYWETSVAKKAREAHAKLLCHACPVQPQCLEFAMVASEGHGVWGGLNERERCKLAFARAREITFAETAESVGTVA